MWLEKYYEDFEENGELLTNVSNFAMDTLSHNYENLAIQIKKLLLNEVERISVRLTFLRGLKHKILWCMQMLTCMVMFMLQRQ